MVDEPILFKKSVPSLFLSSTCRSELIELAFQKKKKFDPPPINIEKLIKSFHYFIITSSKFILCKLGAMIKVVMRKIIGNTKYAACTNQNSLELAPPTYISFALHSILNLSTPNSSSSKNHLIPIILRPVIFFVVQKSMTIKMNIN